jgi:hypothetical protein
MTEHDPETGMAEQLENEPGYRFDAELSSLRDLEYDVRNNEIEERRAQGRAARQAGSYKWHYDDTGWYAYVLLNGDKALRDATADELRRAGISYLIPGRSHKPADNGKRYEWYVRVGYVQEHPSAQIVGDALAKVQGLIPDRPEEGSRPGFPLRPAVGTRRPVLRASAKRLSIGKVACALVKLLPRAR